MQEYANSQLHKYDICQHYFSDALLNGKGMKHTLNPAHMTL